MIILMRHTLMKISLLQAHNASGWSVIYIMVFYGTVHGMLGHTSFVVCFSEGFVSILMP
jgi:hypothetical protein